MNASDLLERAFLLVPLVLSLTVHEFSHAFSANRLGDDTAARSGRLTLNPIAHIDPIGTLLLPLLGIPFGWAKPVPIDATRFRRNVSMLRGTMITAAVGPLSNVALAVISTVAYGLLFRWAPGMASQESGVAALLRMCIQINVILAIFNAIPIPPLDGSRVVSGLIPAKLRPGWDQLGRFSPLLLLALVLFGQPLLEGPSRFAQGLLNQLLLAIAT